MCQAEARWSLRRPPALATPVNCPGLSARGWRPGAPRRCHSALLPGASRRPASSWALLPAWGSPQGGLAGARCRSRPAARQSPRRALPRGRRRPLSTVPGLSAAAVAVCLRGGPGGLGVGKARETQPWSWKGLREAICSSSAWGEAGQRHQGTAATAPGVLAPADGAPGLGSQDLLRPRTVERTRGCPRGPLLLGPPLSCQRWSGGAAAPNYTPYFPGGREAADLSLPHIHLLGNPRRHRLPAWARAALGATLGQGTLTPGRSGAPRTDPAAGVSCSMRLFLFFLLCHKPCRPLGNAGLRG